MLRKVLDKLLDLGDIRLVDKMMSYLNKAFLPSFRSDANHPSEIGSAFFCQREKVIDAICEDNDVEVERRTAARSQLIFNIGHALHDSYRQDYLGPMGVLWGKWRCSRCHEVTEGFMPKEACGCVVTHLPDGTHRAYGERCQKICGDGVITDEALAERAGCNHCGKWGSWDYEEIRVSIPEWNIDGHIDGIIKDGDKEYILDIKTIKPDKFIEMVKPYDSYIRQLTVYMRALGMKKAMLFFICKSTGQVKQFPVEYDEAVFQDIVRVGIVEVAELIKDKKLPRMHKFCRPNSLMRNSCAVSEYCLGCRKYASVEKKVKAAK